MTISFCIYLAIYFNFVVHDYKLHEAHADMLICFIVHDIIDIMNILDWNSPKRFLEVFGEQHHAYTSV